MRKQTFTFALILTFLMLCSELQAQEIDLHFPHFAGHQYEWKIFRGKDQITVQSEKIPPDARITLIMPRAYQDYRGIADKIYENQEDHIAYFNYFVTHTLDFKDLYTSGHWDQALHHWVMMNVRSDKGDQAFQDRLNNAITRMDRDDILAAFAEKAVPLLVEKGKDDLLPTISTHLETRPASQAALSGSVKNMVASVKILTGTKGPDLFFKAPVRTQTGVVNQDITIDTGNLDAAYTILLFYQGECPLCEDALIDLANKYTKLKEQNVRVIGISADKTEQGFQKKLVYHQWPDNYCDFTGMSGQNFSNYAVLGVPTLFLLDQEGTVLKKTAMVDELIKVIDG